MPSPCLCPSNSFYVIQFDHNAYTSHVEASGDIGDEGVEEAFDVVAEISEVFIAPYAHTESCSTLAASVSKWPNGLAMLHLHQIGQLIELPRWQPDLHHHSFRHMRLQSLCCVEDPY